MQGERWHDCVNKGEEDLTRSHSGNLKVRDTIICPGSGKEKTGGGRGLWVSVVSR